MQFNNLKFLIANDAHFPSGFEVAFATYRKTESSIYVLSICNIWKSYYFYGLQLRRKSEMNERVNAT